MKMYSGAPFSLLVENQIAPNFFLPVDFGFSAAPCNDCGEEKTVVLQRKVVK
jgi:hypothetical protein